ncbi:RNA methyltransferase [Neomegalonema perideroedes]|uniref:RNA methyltransferase n=1 Tax=Neomegalonema perideroedes TaxID=217219 RepID=UPI00035DDE23|nr:RNA methyltransferase [Neomegalonema perideroedes]
MSSLENRAAEAPEGALPHAPAMILVRPQLAENIGAAARAMWNFGLWDLRLVAPRDGWPQGRAWAACSGAEGPLDRARVFETTAEAVADLNHVYATTARSRDLHKEAATPEEAARFGLARAKEGWRIGFLFGPERTGLENDDVERAAAICSVPVNPAFKSLNLAQCVLLTSYEWRQAAMAEDEALAAPPPEAPSPAPRAQIDALLSRMVEELDDSGFFWPEARRASVESSLRNALYRAPFTAGEAKLLFGVVDALARVRKSPNRRD